MTAALGGQKAAARYADQVLALHQALALLRIHLISPELMPDAVERAAAILEGSTQPLRKAPLRRLRPLDPGQREASIRRRIESGMSESVAELTWEWGVRVGPDGQDLEATA